MRKTGAKLESFVVGQEDMLDLAEKSWRGRMVNAIIRHAVIGLHDDCKYIDANYLYGWAILQKLPVGGFHWGDVSNFGGKSPADLRTMIMRMDPNSDLGALLEFDIELLEQLHDCCRSSQRLKRKHRPPHTCRACNPMFARASGHRN